ncbi:MAG: helix-turn-helix transcriptional regulator [Lachnospiraceae bacterium]|nr:helix-turn-helix transcriptional regulator [Lachnospiraceae bacterium]
MITCAKLFQTMKEKHISSYRLINYYQISRSMLDRLKHDKPITTTTLNSLCEILDCRVEDIITYIPDKKDEQ